MKEDNELDSADVEGFAARLKEAIGNESVRSFSRRLGMSDRGIRAYLSGGSYPTLEKLVQISQLTGVDLNWLATGIKKEAKREQAEETEIQFQPSMQTRKIMELIETLNTENRREILLRIEALHRADRNAKRLSELENLVDELKKKLG